MKDARLVLAVFVAGLGLVYFTVGAPKTLAVGLLIVATVLLLVALLDRLTLGDKR